MTTRDASVGDDRESVGGILFRRQVAGLTDQLLEVLDRK